MPDFRAPHGLLALCTPLRSLADWVYTSGCVICGRECHSVLPLCSICRHRLPIFTEPLCPVCRHFVPGQQPHHNCLAGEETPSLVWTCGIFDAGYRPLIHALKYEYQHSIGEFFGRRIGTRLAGSFGDDENTPLIVPVPLHPAREKRRGYNQSSAIAAGVARATGFPPAEQLLHRIRRTRDQTRLSPEKRLANVRDAFKVPRPGCFEGRRVILVDDVMTTGATLRECTRVIIANGALEVQAVVLALAKPVFIKS